MPTYTAKPGAMRWPVPPGAGGDGTPAMSRRLAGIQRRLSLPPEVTGDPDPQTADPRPAHAARPLPDSLEAALAALRRSEVIPEAMGAVLYDAFTAVRAAEAETFGGLDPDAIAAAHRWIY